MIPFKGLQVDIYSSPWLKVYKDYFGIYLLLLKWFYLFYKVYKKFSYSLIINSDVI